MHYLAMSLFASSTQIEHLCRKNATPEVDLNIHVICQDYNICQPIGCCLKVAHGQINSRLAYPK